MEFYANGYPALRQYTRRKPEACQVVEKAFDLGYDVVIATNPLFPATAIEQRLEWADLADFPYRLVTTYENSRACKPNLLYYEQILENIGHCADACLMVGDEDRDMIAARWLPWERCSKAGSEQVSSLLEKVRQYGLL